MNLPHPFSNPFVWLFIVGGPAFWLIVRGTEPVREKSATMGAIMLGTLPFGVGTIIYAALNEDYTLALWGTFGLIWFVVSCGVAWVRIGAQQDRERADALKDPTSQALLAGKTFTVTDEKTQPLP